MDKIRILIVEDYKLIRVGIKTLFKDVDFIDVIAEAETAEEAIRLSGELKPDIILLDIGLPDRLGYMIIPELIEKSPTSKIIILSSYTGIDEIEKSIAAGAYAYVIKDVSTDVLTDVVKSVYNGAMWFDPKIVPYIRAKSDNNLSVKVPRKVFKSTHSNLTHREFEVLKLIVEGLSNNEIAKKLCISEHTAKAHVCNIIQKLVVDDRTQAAVKALKEGIIE